MTHPVRGAPESGEPLSQPALSVSGERPLSSLEPATWTRTLTRLVALGWGTAELALWGARPQALGFIAAMILGTEGVMALAKIRDLLR